MSRARWIQHYLFTRGRSYRYGHDRSQAGDLHLPPGAGPHPVVVLIHGGSWHKRYGRAVMRALAADLLERGFAVWNIEYRRIGNGGGWPATFADVAAAIDRLDGLHPSLDLSRVDVLGHSAGGQLALWAAGRPELPSGAPGAAPQVVARRALAMAAVCELESAGRPARLLLGGSPSEVPERWAQADPMRRIPLDVPVALVHAQDDRTVSVQRSREYAAAARAAGADVTLAEPPGGHRDVIDPRSRAWKVAAEWLSGSAAELGA
jgi:acetyl esterase/lipase